MLWMRKERQRYWGWLKFRDQQFHPMLYRCCLSIKLCSEKCSALKGVGIWCLWCSIWGDGTSKWFITLPELKLPFFNSYIVSPCISGRAVRDTNCFCGYYFQLSYCKGKDSATAALAWGALPGDCAVTSNFASANPWRLMSRICLLSKWQL